MKKVLSIALLLTGISFASFAQENTGKSKEGRQRGDRKEMVQKSPEEVAKFRTDRLDKVVTLTDAQRTQVYSLYLKEAQANKEVKEGQKKTKEVQATKSVRDSKKKGSDVRKKGRDASRTELNKILTPEQQKLMSESFKKREQDKNTKGKDSKRDKKDGTKKDRK